MSYLKLLKHASFSQNRLFLRRSLFIETDPHQPNPDAIRFLPHGKEILDKGQFIHYTSLTEARNSPLAMRLFQIDGIKEVSLGENFFTVTRLDDSHLWQVLKPHVIGTVTDFFMTNLPVISDEEVVKSSLDIEDDDDELTALIKQLLEERIRPYLLSDGGDIELIDWDETSGVLSIKLVGACNTCPSKGTTLDDGIEGMMKHYVPEITKVVHVENEVDTIAEEEFKKFEEKLAKAKEEEAAQREIDEAESKLDPLFNMIRTTKQRGQGPPEGATSEEPKKW